MPALTQVRGHPVVWRFCVEFERVPSAVVFAAMAGLGWRFSEGVVPFWAGSSQGIRVPELVERCPIPCHWGPSRMARE